MSLSQASIRPQTTERMMGPKKEGSWRNIPREPRHAGMLIVVSMGVNSSCVFVHQAENTPLSMYVVVISEDRG
jgi:hypothetical protein